jgi:hypothetical protein
MISDQPIMGSDVSQTLASLQYNPDAGYTQGLQMESEEAPEIPPELLAALMAEQEGPQFAATGGPVGKPDDTYYFTVEDIQGMMQEPDPMMQAVGAGLMQQMPPGGGMVPATPGQIQMMAEGGLVGNQHKIDKNNNGRIDGQDFQILRRQDGGQTNLMTTDPRDVGPDYDEIVMLESSDNGNELVEGVDYFNIGGKFFWPWELQEAIPEGFQNAKKTSSFLESLPEKPSIKELLRLKNLATPGQLQMMSNEGIPRARLNDRERDLLDRLKEGDNLSSKELHQIIDFVGYAMEEVPPLEEVPIRRSEGGGISVLKKFEDFVTESVGIDPKDVEWASSLSEEMYPGEGFDGRGDAARHLALGSLIPDAESPRVAEFLSAAREYFPIPDSGRKMDLHNNELGMQLKGSKEEIKEQIRELIDNNTAMYMTLDESQKMRGY